MLLTVLAGLIVAIFFVPFGKTFKSGLSIVLTALPIGIFSYYLTHLPSISLGKEIFQSTSWVPSLGINLDFRLDGLSLLFALLISGIGIAVYFYARTYLKGHAYFDRFFAYLSLFMAAMLGMVLADNILLLFIFWELTSISSFFLIGFNNTSPDSRKSALTALSVTGLGGFFLLAGLILLGDVAGTYNISALIHARGLIVNHGQYPLILTLLFIGAFTKSAQFPFHFWLPGAMKAPTPVSAYLHSATMVKAGIYLLARFNPILGGTNAWSYTLMIVGGFTMLYAAIHALLRTDLKSILAYSTISALGILTFLIGLGTADAIIAASVFILVHALYKASLFLITGIIDHAAHTRDISLLSGLRKVLLPVAIAGFLAACSSAGLPFTFGFIGKDLIYEATLHANSSWKLGLTTLAVLTNICLVAAGFMAGIKPFTGSLPIHYQTIRLPYISMWLPPLTLAVLGVLFGLMPDTVGNLFAEKAVLAMLGTETKLNLKIWHGFNTVLLLSLLTIVTGAVLYRFNKPIKGKTLWLLKFKNFSPEFIFKKITVTVFKFSEWYTQKFHNGYLRSYHLQIILFAEALLAYKLWLSGPIDINFYGLAMLSVYEVAIAILLIGALIIILTTRTRLTAVVSMSVIGYCICLMFVFYSAPDLAMTQFTIDTLTTVLFVLVLYKLPPFLNLGTKKERYRDMAIALGFGLILCMVALQVHHEPIETATSDFYGDYAYTEAKGKNVVNVILVDFRGMDTLFETVALSIAAIGVYNLLRLRLKPTEKE
ncbi:hydrogen gas-evolving membrane-bound hydrogenase subunit E [Niabella insulamsoli]|uniref:hydrogen gas-evolving membrane-bound hydrogenase subunit E n=1 Tax=Niabella insulamsoli TaxID=3144874 RepID=UPI0031FD4393